MSVGQSFLSQLPFPSDHVQTLFNERRAFQLWSSLERRRKGVRNRFSRFPQRLHPRHDRVGSRRLIGSRPCQPLRRPCQAERDGRRLKSNQETVPDPLSMPPFLSPTLLSPPPFLLLPFRVFRGPNRSWRRKGDRNRFSRFPQRGHDPRHDRVGTRRLIGARPCQPLPAAMSSRTEWREPEIQSSNGS